MPAGVFPQPDPRLRGLSQSLNVVVDWAVWGRISQRPYEGSPA